MATQYIPFDPAAGVPDATNPPQIVLNSGTNFPVRAVAFDGTTNTDEVIYYYFVAVNYGSGNLTLDIDWYATTSTTTSHSVIWGAQIAVITPNTDSQDIEADSFATAQTVTDDILGTTAKRLHRASLTISNLDSLAADDWVCLKFYRDESETGDDLEEDAFVVGLTLSYSDA